MRGQTAGILALVFVCIVAAFAVINVDPVQVNYFIGTAEVPLILVILFSALLGGIIVGFFSLVRYYKGQRSDKRNQVNARDESAHAPGNEEAHSFTKPSVLETPEENDTKNK
ncbi:LapA family protein [Aureibacillus halotolerans]|uniref:Putative integral membrane protein n=1 Tax=Aureibacillus halotolerans TaxID=1508390 RepID=A0A4R6TVY8_9BACI|nr:lipopolysaccharide assembly protein LapA domain-containing protein [Aureibacillus halotolerans]TDQ37990.1 putative integral membrane protein [Aureibacillus halotolerans]